LVPDDALREWLKRQENGVLGNLTILVPFGGSMYENATFLAQKSLLSVKTNAILSFRNKNGWLVSKVMTVMLIRDAIALVSLLASGSSLLRACECANYTPIQKTLAEYSDRAVFTARIVQLTGKVETLGGKRHSILARAVTLKRYWGLPWYWPQAVVLDGNGPCGTEFEAGEEYLVSGDLGRYGVVHVQLCSRTMPIRFAKVDLRTLDGSHCAAPGGTILGVLHSPPTGQRSVQVYPGETLALTDAEGKLYNATTDADGIFELRNLPEGSYLLDPRLTTNKYTPGGAIQVRKGICVDASRFTFPYVITGRISGFKPPAGEGLLETPSVELVPLSIRVKDPQTLITRAQADGNFFFEEVPPGEYLLGVNLTVAPSARIPLLSTYYPGTTDRRKAARISVGKERVAGSFDFVPMHAALANVPVIVTFPDGTLVPRWYAALEVAWAGNKRWTGIDYTMGWSTGWGGLIGLAGHRHRIVAHTALEYGADEATERCSDPIEIDAKPDAKPVRIVLNHRCAAGR
jgi:hypothetical protein